LKSDARVQRSLLKLDDENHCMNEPSPPPLVSAIIVCYNSSQWLAKCLESLRAQTIFPQMEILVVDNASSDDSEKMARQIIEEWPNANFLQTGSNAGYCAANSGAKIARGKYLYILNPDTWLEPDCVEQLHVTVEREQAGAGGPTILNYEDNSLQAKCAIGFDFSGDLMLPRTGRDSDVAFCPGAFFFIRRDLFVRIGMMDEKLFMYCEELDLSWRIAIAGERVVAVPSARIHHRGEVGVNPAGGTKVVENRTSAQKRFLANRNRLIVTAKSGQHVLLLMLIPCAALVLAEGLATWAITRSWPMAKATSFAALADFWRLRSYIRQQRRHIRDFRRHGDFWMLRFFCFGFSRWYELTKIVKLGFPKFK
jgi:hypothetical protein